MQLCSKPRCARGIEPKTFRRRGSAFILTSDHWTTCASQCETVSAGECILMTSHHNIAEHVEHVNLHITNLLATSKPKIDMYSSR